MAPIQKVLFGRGGSKGLHWTIRRRLSTIPSPPPPWSSWADYVEQQASRQGGSVQPPRLRQLDPSGQYGGYFQSIAGLAGPPGSADAATSAQQQHAQQTVDDERLAFVRDFSMRPRDVVSKLNEYVIGQESAKRVLAVAVCDHFNHARRCLRDSTVADAERSKPNVLIVGPTGSGKTFLVRTLARLLRAPFIKADATKFSATGFVGRDVEDLIKDLVDAAGGDLRAAEHGVIYVDEVDKLCSASGGLAGLFGGGGGGGSVNTRDVQTSLLKLMEDADVSLGPAGGAQPSAEARRSGAPQGRRLSTRHVLWIFSGAFNQMHSGLYEREAEEDKQVAAHALEVEAAERARAESHEGLRPLGEQQPLQPEQASGGAAAGAAADCPRTALTRRRRALDRARSTVAADSLVEAGLEPEFIGRLPVRVRCSNLTEQDYVDILLNSKASVLNQIADDFRGYGIEFTISETAVRSIARLAMAQGTGARGLVTIVESIMRDVKYELPSAGISHFFVDDHMVSDPDSALQELLRTHRKVGYRKEQVARSNQSIAAQRPLRAAVAAAPPSGAARESGAGRPNAGDGSESDGKS